MESLENLFAKRQFNLTVQTDIHRLKIYIQKKYSFNPEISLASNKLIIYAPTSSQTTVLRLDLSNLNQLISHQYALQIRLKRKTKPASD